VGRSRRNLSSDGEAVSGAVPDACIRGLLHFEYGDVPCERTASAKTHFETFIEAHRVLDRKLFTSRCKLLLDADQL